jgi:hypothetical protein
VLAALAFSSSSAAPARAGVDACFKLAEAFGPAIDFVKNNASCIDKLGDPVFVGISGLLAAAMSSGQLKGACTDVLKEVNSPTVQTLLKFTNGNLGIVADYLTCSCSVAEYGVGLIQDVADDLKSCSSAFNISECDVEKFLGASCGPGYSGPPTPTTEYLTLPACDATTLGTWIAGKKYGNGTVLGGQTTSISNYYQTCACPAPTGLITASGPQPPLSALGGQYFKCAACPDGQALQNGTCAACPTTKTISADHRCLSTLTTFASPGGVDCGGGGSGASPKCCALGQHIDSSGACSPACGSGFGYYMDAKSGQCGSCPANFVAAFDSDSTKNSLGHCNECPAGQTSQSGEAACSALTCGPAGYPDPNSAHACLSCPSGQQYFANTKQCGCPTGSAAKGNTCACPKGANKINWSGFFTCACPAGAFVDEKTFACRCPIGSSLDATGMKCKSAPQATPVPVAPPTGVIPGTPRRDCATLGPNFINHARYPARCVPCAPGRVANANRTACIVLGNRPAPGMLRMPPQGAHILPAQVPPRAVGAPPQRLILTPGPRR